MQSKASVFLRAGADRRTRAPSGLSDAHARLPKAAPSLSLWARYGSCACASGRGPTTPAPRGCRPVFSLTAPAVGSPIAPLEAGLKPGAPAPVPSPPQSRRLGGSRCSGRCRLPPSQMLSGGGRASLRETARSCYAAAHSRRREVASALWADTASLTRAMPAGRQPSPLDPPGCRRARRHRRRVGVREVCASRTCRMVSGVPGVPITASRAGASTVSAHDLRQEYAGRV